MIMKARVTAGALAISAALHESTRGYRTMHHFKYHACIGICVLALAGHEALAQTPQSAETGESSAVARTAHAGGPEEVIVTGTRLVLTDGSSSPTPLTVVSTEQLQATTPTNIPDALNKLPVFQGSQQPRRAGEGSANAASNLLNLRGFGAQRTLVLLDGRRATPSNADGTVNIDTLPQLLIERVDVVTGGASAVYGSDAVTGVVNFILDKDFTGLKFDASTGRSTYEDGDNYKVGMAGGMELFGGRGHVLASYQHFEQDPVRNFDRPYGPSIFVRTGNGSLSNPFTVTRNTRRADSTFGGLVTACTPPCSALRQQFVADGVLGAYNPGTPTGTANQNSGGDGAYSRYSTALVGLRTDEGFARFSYDLGDSASFFIQGSLARGFSDGWHFPAKLTPGNGQASTFYKNNPFLSPQVQAALGNNGLSNATNTFSLGSYITNTGPEGLTGTNNDNRTFSVTTGVDGTLNDRYNWSVFYTHGENDLRVENLNNSNYQKQFAALDAVTGGDGRIQCYAATQAATAAAYADCVPLNAFGPTAITPAMFGYFTGTTFFDMTNTMDDVGVSIAGPAFDNWAGEVKFALSAEGRWNSYKVASTADPSATVDCTGLRICNPNLPLWAQPVLADVDVSNNVWEVAAEVQVPLLRDLPLVTGLDANLAARHTDYSTSGEVQTWKVGLDYSVNDQLRFRAITSRDIRAPTLNDLFQPLQRASTGFVDLHTATSNTLFQGRRGNPDLQPEKARTYSVGVVWRPDFISGFTTSLDYYKIQMDNAIGLIEASNPAVQRLCESSGGASPYCALFIRPLPFADRSPANFPTEVLNLSLNTAESEIQGYDFEASYGFDMADLAPSWSGSWNLRLFANYQPIRKSQAFPGAPLLRYAAGNNLTSPETAATAFVTYQLDDWTVGLQDRWVSSYSQVTQAGEVWADPHVGSFNTVDANVERRFAVGGIDWSAYFTVQNAFNAKPDIVPSGGSVGLVYPVPSNQDIMGRYYTVGVRARM
jgi:outer membrane receptor protein involved in Fe transport